MLRHSSADSAFSTGVNGQGMVTRKFAASQASQPIARVSLPRWYGCPVVLSVAAAAEWPMARLEEEEGSGERARNVKRVQGRSPLGMLSLEDEELRRQAGT